MRMMPVMTIMMRMRVKRRCAGIFPKELTQMETVERIQKLIPGINHMSKQYFWGGDRSGAALHYHVAAFNVLFVGEKEWYVPRAQKGM